MNFQQFILLDRSRVNIIERFSQKLELEPEHHQKTKKVFIYKKACYNLNVKTSEDLFWPLPILKTIV